MNYIFAILFIIFSIYFGLRDIKERNLNFKQKLKTFLFYLYFGISMSLFSCFITIEKYISILIFLHLLFIFSIISIIKRKNIYSCIVLLLVLTIGIILIILNYLNLKIHTLLWISLGLSIYFLPVATYLDRKISILRKIKICTTEIEAKIIKVYKSTYNYNTSVIKRLLALDGDQISIAKVHVVQGNDNYTEYRFMRIKEGSSEIEIVYEDYIAGYGIWNSYVPILDNEVYYEPYFYRMFLEDSQTTTHYVEGVGNVKFYTVMPGQIFYMGDNRTGSTDARWTGTDSQENVIGRVVSIVHNSTSIQNSLFWWTGRIKEYFAIVFDEIIKYFAWTY